MRPTGPRRRQPMEPSTIVCRPEQPGEEPAVRAVVADAFVAEPVVADLVDGLAVLTRLDRRAVVRGRGRGPPGGPHPLHPGRCSMPRGAWCRCSCLGPVGVATLLPAAGHRLCSGPLGLEQVRQRAEPVVFLEGSPVYYLRFGFEPGGPLRLSPALTAHTGGCLPGDQAAQLRVVDDGDPRLLPALLGPRLRGVARPRGGVGPGLAGRSRGPAATAGRLPTITRDVERFTAKGGWWVVAQGLLLAG